MKSGEIEMQVEDKVHNCNAKRAISMQSDMYWLACD